MLEYETKCCLYVAENTFCRGESGPKTRRFEPEKFLIQYCWEWGIFCYCEDAWMTLSKKVIFFVSSRLLTHTIFLSATSSQPASVHHTPPCLLITRQSLQSRRSVTGQNILKIILGIWSNQTLTVLIDSFLGIGCKTN